MPSASSASSTTPSVEASPETPSAQQTDRPRKGTLPPGYEPRSGRSVSSSPSWHTETTSPRSPRPGPSLPTRLWRTVKSIYYASSPAWQFLKSGALFLLGLFCWSAANLLLSYEPSWHWPYFFMAYGFLLTPYGPFTHLVLVPHVIPWLRRRTRDGWLHWLGRHLTETSLTVFFTAVLLMGLYPPPVMQMDFQGTTGATRSDIDPMLACSSAAASDGTTVTCQLQRTAGVGSITVESGGARLLQTSAPPYEFSLEQVDVAEVVGQHQFQVVVRDTEGAPVRRFTRTWSMIQ